MATADHSITQNTPAPPKTWADTPEALIRSIPVDSLGDLHSILCCVLARAEAVIVLLSNELESDDHDHREEVVIHALWDVLGNLEIARSLMKGWSCRGGE